jgi:leader peptidase (prepilin peptidase)/N-methyltransferase
MVQLLLALIGLLAGGVINALADDLPSRAELRQPRCPACDQRYAPIQWVAVVAFLTGRGRCGFCDASLALRRVLVEIVSALMLVFLYDKFGPSLKFLLLAVLLEGLWLITIIDLEHRLILYITIFPMIGVAILYSLFGAERSWQRTLVGGLVGFGVVYLIYLLGWVFGAVAARRRGEPLNEIPFGGGDVNLAAVLGLAVGWSGILLSLFITVMTGGLGALIYMLFMSFRRRYDAFTPIPYGPFLVLGAVVLLVFDAEIRQYFAGQ